MTETPAAPKEGRLARFVETAFTVALPLFSLAYIWQATRITQPPHMVGVGPRTFPLLVGLLMLGFSLYLVWQHWHGRSARDMAQTEGSESSVVPIDEDETSISDWPAVWTVLGALIALFVLFERLGFVTAVSLFLFALSTLFSPQRWLLNLVASLIFSTLLYYLFARVLAIPLPIGVFRFLF